MEGRAAAWTLLAIVVLFKVGTALLILYHTRPASDAYALLVATHWYLVIPVVLVLAGPALYWYRLLRVRARRKRLRQAEWNVD